LQRSGGVTKENSQRRPPQEGESEQAADRADGDSLNPFAIGAGFLTYCVRQGWLIQEGKGRRVRYYATEAGREALK